jgi:DNA gyrase subunit A
MRDDDRAGWIDRARARQTVTFFTEWGMAYTGRVNDIPMTTGPGEPSQKQFGFEDREHLVGVACHDPRCLPEPGATPQAATALVQVLPNGELAELNGDGAAPAAPPAAVRGGADRRGGRCCGSRWRRWQASRPARAALSSGSIR